MLAETVEAGVLWFWMSCGSCIDLVVTALSDNTENIHALKIIAANGPLRWMLATRQAHFSPLWDVQSH